MINMNVKLPDVLAKDENYIRNFIDAMVYKLSVNAHKGSIAGMNIDGSFKRLKDEIEELEDAIDNGTSMHIILEAADVANFAMIICTTALNPNENKEKSLSPIEEWGQCLPEGGLMK